MGCTDNRPVIAFGPGLFPSEMPPELHDSEVPGELEAQIERVRMMAEEMRTYTPPINPNVYHYAVMRLCYLAEKVNQR